MGNSYKDMELKTRSLRLLSKESATISAFTPWQSRERALILDIVKYSPKKLAHPYKFACGPLKNAKWNGFSKGKADNKLELLGIFSCIKLLGNCACLYSWNAVFITAEFKRKKTCAVKVQGIINWTLHAFWRFSGVICCTLRTPLVSGRIISFLLRNAVVFLI